MCPAFEYLVHPSSQNADDLGMNVIQLLDQLRNRLVSAGDAHEYERSFNNKHKLVIPSHNVSRKCQISIGQANLPQVVTHISHIGHHRSERSHEGG